MPPRQQDMRKKRLGKPGGSSTHKPGKQAGRKRKGEGREEEVLDDDFFDDEEDEMAGDTAATDSVHRQSRDGEDAASGEGWLGDGGETADEKRLRVAKAYLARVRASTAGAESENEDDEEEEEEEGARGGARDSLVAAKLLEQTQELLGRSTRRLAASVAASGGGREGQVVGRRHRQPVTALVLSDDDRTAFSASKDGLIVQLDIETNTTFKFPDPPPASTSATTATAPARKGGKGGQQKREGSRHVLALAVSSDGRFIASGGLDCHVHIWDARSRQHLQVFPGHKGCVSSLAFRTGTHQLFSGSFDRSVKLWSIDDMAYMDSLYGHQSEVIALDCLRAERVLTSGYDRTCRLWKVPEETQLVFRGHSASIDCCRFVNSNEFISGSSDGSVALWSAARKKPTFVFRRAHGSSSSPHHHWDGPHEHTIGNGNGVGKSAREELDSDDDDDDEVQGKELGSSRCRARDDDAPAIEVTQHTSGHTPNGLQPATGGGSVCGSGEVESWVGAVAVCRASDLAASGAGDGLVKLWAIESQQQQQQPRLKPILSLQARGFVNALAFANSGRFLLAGTGQEPRLGRWGRNPDARNGLLMYRFDLNQ